MDKSFDSRVEERSLIGLELDLLGGRGSAPPSLLDLRWEFSCKPPS